MSAYCGTYNSPNPLKGLFIFAAFIFAALGTIVVLGEHAAKHSLASTVRNCDTNNLKMQLKNPITGRIAFICQPDPNEMQFGRMIVEVKDGIQKEVTSFMSRKYKDNTLRAVVKNMSNQGYTEILYIAEDIKDAVIIILSTP